MKMEVGSVGSEYAESYGFVMMNIKGPSSTRNNNEKQRNKIQSL